MIRPQTCPVCGKELAADTDTNSSLFPFCSDRCRLIDFFRWSEGKYAIVEPIDPGHVDSQTESGDEEP